MMSFQHVPVVEIHGQSVVDDHWGEVPHGAVVVKTEYPGEETGGLLFIFGRDDRMVQRNGDIAPLLSNDFQS